MGFISIIFSLAAVGVGIGLAIFVLIAVPMFIYTIPYMCWFGWNSGSKGVPKKPESDNYQGFKWLTHNAKNATKLYKSWITKQPHNITQF